MIVDVHAHCWPSPDCFSKSFQADARRMRIQAVDLVSRVEDYRASTGGEEVVSIVFGGKARLGGVWIDDDDVAAYVARDPGRMIGFMSLDPTQAGWQDEMHDGRERLGFRGIKLLPMYAGFYPQEERLGPLWSYATAHNLPVLLHTGTTFVANAPIDCTLPRHLDAVAIRYPDVKIILAHLGHPYEGETVAVIRKHANVYADISALFYRPWQLFHSLMLVHEYNVWEKLLFGTDYPVTTVGETVAGLRSLCDVRIDRFGLPKDRVEELIYRDAFGLLGLPDPRPPDGAAGGLVPAPTPRDIRYGKEGLTALPIPLVGAAQAYIDARIPHWVYDCCFPQGPRLNRFMDTPLAKVRMSGWLSYHHKAGGFLHWGFIRHYPE